MYKSVVLNIICHCYMCELYYTKHILLCITYNLLSRYTSCIMSGISRSNHLENNIRRALHSSQNKTGKL